MSAKKEGTVSAISDRERARLWLNRYAPCADEPMDKAVRRVGNLAALLGEVREECCRAVCDQCKDGVPVELDEATPSEWVHENGEGCLADQIRSLSSKDPS